MDQPKLPQPAPPQSAFNLTDAEYESWLARARAFATPGEPGFVPAVDSLRPSLLLAAVIEVSTSDLSRLSDAEIGALLWACERLITYARYLQFLIISELARRDIAV
jgi:hypothetical protein